MLLHSFKICLTPFKASSYPTRSRSFHFESKTIQSILVQRPPQFTHFQFYSLHSLIYLIPFTVCTPPQFYSLTDYSPSHFTQIKLQIKVYASPQFTLSTAYASSSFKYSSSLNALLQFSVAHNLKSYFSQFTTGSSFLTIYALLKF